MDTRKKSGSSLSFFIPMAIALFGFIYFYSSQNTLDEYEKRAQELYANDSINALKDSLDVTTPK